VVLCIALALVADSLILAVGRVLTPWSKSRVRAQPVRGEVRAGIPRVPVNPE
jgi:hypothetical protein